MSNILIINGYQPYNFAPGSLNRAFAERAKAFFEKQGDQVRVTTVVEGYDVEAEIASHQWADTIIMQFPIHCMATPWNLKKYQDEVYTAGMDGRLATGDGRSAEAPTENYGMSGALKGKTYMLSVTFNAPVEAFNDPEQAFFAGASVDTLLYPSHQNGKFLGLEKLPTFVAYDVMKNPQVEADFARFDAHLRDTFAKVAEPAE
ncbi:NAD(P)H-dependent oxidoreductase [Parasedimentitalea maritima]|uniref:Flavodoxin family protein n=1 Tax=Parasedimentitalea maritima TaxID=2578117 RepID=A0A6A4RII3_9RHOB|nr:NAD(P)H-dependent oxidoreductase [Zongyanglinia marina]KAE9631073.1 flavodoxin family protein [Zongyanglinia marina]